MSQALRASSTSYNTVLALEDISMASHTEEECGALPLLAAFDRAMALYGNGSPAPKSTQELLGLLEHCQHLVERAALFSSNEDQDDLSTSSMKYLMLPFIKADVLSSMPQQDMAQRLQQVAAARAAYSHFLQRCSQYGLLGSSCQATYDSEEQGGRPDPGSARIQKIERFKRSKAVGTLIQQLQGRRKRADEESGTEGGPPGGVGGWDEEDERLLWKMQLEAAAIKALDARPTLDQELQLLQHAATAKQQQGGSQITQSGAASSSSGQQQQRDQSTPEQQQHLQQQMMHRLSDIAGQLSLGRDKQAIRQQVLRPSHILPTLTVEQQGEIELAQAREREARQKAAQAKAAAAAADAGSDDEDDAALAKQRAWDDFKDDNPCGWGNSKLRPCA